MISEGDEMTEKICVIGGDMRNIVAARELSKEGYEVCALGMEKAEVEGSDGITPADGIENAIGGAAVVLLPLPYSVDGETVNAPYSDKTITVKEVFELAGEETLICGGMMGSLSLKRNVIDYYDSEEFKILNGGDSRKRADHRSVKAEDNRQRRARVGARLRKDRQTACFKASSNGSACNGSHEKTQRRRVVRRAWLRRLFF